MIPAAHRGSRGRYLPYESLARL